MIMIGGVGEPSETSSARRAEERERAADTETIKTQDDVNISAAAQDAAQTLKAVAGAITESQIRAQHVEQAKQNIRDGTHKLEEVVAEVAGRISRFL